MDGEKALVTDSFLPSRRSASLAFAYRQPRRTPSDARSTTSSCTIRTSGNNLALRRRFSGLTRESVDLYERLRGIPVMALSGLNSR